ncbi:MAG: hypothetical protein PHR06_05705 [Candidatus Cloacimonetes bacterium]|nr:hypothetical protein [Candidatus Cloacimonadota bacterium]
MKKLFIISIVFSAIGLICLAICRFFLPLPDFVMRIIGISLMISIFTLVFSSVRLRCNHKN